MAGGRVFTTLPGESALLSMDAATGSELWRQIIPDASGIGEPSIHGSEIYLSHNSPYPYHHTVTAFSTANGSVRWSSQQPGQFSGFAPAVDASDLCVAGHQRFFGFDAVTGTQRFSVSSPFVFGLWTPALFEGAACIFVGGNFSAYEPSTGAVLWSLLLSGSPYSAGTLACDTDRAVGIRDAASSPVGARGLVCFDLTRRAVAWTVDGNFTGTPAIANGTVFAIANGTTVEAFDLGAGVRSGNFVAPADNGLLTQPILTNDTLVCYSSNRTHLFDRQSRALRQTIPYGGKVSISGNKLYIASPDGVLRMYAVPDPVNTAPTAVPISAETSEDTDVIIQLAGTDPEGDPLRFAITKLPIWGKLFQVVDGSDARGTAILSVPALATHPTGRVIYAPPENLHGTRLGNFSYVAGDSHNPSEPATVTISITPVNDPPVARDDPRSVLPGQTLSPVRELANDWDVEGDACSRVSYSQPVAGRVVENPDGTLRYDPPADVTSGVDTFTYTIQDSNGETAQATVRVTIGAEPSGFWPTVGNGPDHAGYSPALLEGGPWILRWSSGVGTSCLRPIVAEGKVFVFASRVAAFDEKTGAQVWARDFPNDNSTGEATYQAGMLYAVRNFGMYDTEFDAFSAASGNTVWSIGVPYWADGAPPVLDDEGAYFSSSGILLGATLASRDQNGVEFQLFESHRYNPSLHRGKLFTLAGGIFREHDKTTGNASSTLDLGWYSSSFPAWGPVAFSGNTACMVNDDPEGLPPYSPTALVTVDLSSFSVSWKKVVPSLRGTPSVHDGVVYAISGNLVLSFGQWDGAPLVTFAAPELLDDQAIVTDDFVVAASWRRTFVFDRTTGNLVATLPQGGHIAVADDQILISSNDGTISAYGPPAAVTFSPAGGGFTEPTLVTLNTPGSTGRIHFTADGSAPGPDDPSVMPGTQVSVGASCQLRAVRVDGSSVSRIHRAVYTVLDSDTDGIPDWWELLHFGNFVKADSMTDMDRDGALDLDEFAANTSPWDPRDVFVVQDIQTQIATDRSLVVVWPGKADRGYAVEFSEHLVAWRVLSPILPGVDGKMDFRVPADTPSGFYRVRASPLDIRSH